MKDLYLTLSLFLLWIFPFQQINATAQIAERIIINGDTISMFSCPLEYLPHKEYEELDKMLDKKYSSTALWRAYMGTWEIKNNQLYLLKVEDKNGEIRVSHILQKYNTPNGIKASWFSGIIKCIRGKNIQYVHMGFESVYEYETIYTIKKGKIVSSKNYHNEIKWCTNTDEPWKDVAIFINKNLNKEVIPNYQKDKKIFLVLNLMPDKNGSIKKIEYQLVVRPDYIEKNKINSPFAKELKRCLLLKEHLPTLIFEDKAQPIRYVMPLNGNYFNDVDNIKK